MTNFVNALASKKILVVDDNPHNLHLLFNYLTDSGYKVLVAQNGQQAITTALAIHPNLILLDVLMPTLDGFSTCRHFKTNANTKDIPIIFMTALAETDSKLQGFRLGAVDYITKPIEREELLARIKTHLALQCLHQRLAREAAQQKLLWEISDRIRQSLNLELILKTATQEIVTFLNCDLVWLARLEKQNISLEAISSNAGVRIKPRPTLPREDLCPHLADYHFYLQGNIRTIESSNNEVSLEQFSTLKPSARLIAPILVNLTELTDSPKANQTLWGWLIADQLKAARQWKPAEIDFLKKLTTQLAIAIKQGLLYQQLSQLALLDSLTRVFNRRYFDRQLNQEWRRLQRLSSSLSLIMCDVDYFKLYNDTYGHQQGDLCLQRVAQAIAKVVKRPATDVVARYGGEEFAVILPHTSQSGALKVAEEIRLAVKELEIPHQNSSVAAVVTISVGVAHTVPQAEDNSNVLVKAADLALYQAKERGRDCIAIYSAPLAHAKSGQESEIQWIKRIRQALRENLFSLYAQPITSLQIDEPKKHFEILLRLTDGEEQVISPHLFLERAERNCLMPTIDTWVINNLLEKLAASGDGSDWQNYRFSINLSGASLNSASFLAFLVEKLREYPLPAHLFCFEITETIAISNLGQIAQFINSLKNLGCSFALDDFGTGMSSLTYLKNLPVDYLKIDGSFIKEINNNQASKVMVEAIHHIAEGMGLKTIAEFVENQTILDTVRDLKVDYAQGFYFGRPRVLMDVIHPW